MFDWITGFIDRSGYFGILVLMFLENVFPPIPSELVMPLAGYQAASGDMKAVGVVAAGTAGAMLGALFWYYVGKLIGVERLKLWAARHGRWITLTPREVDRVDAWFDRHCGTAVFAGRLVPAVRTLISVPAGMFGMGLKRFLLFTALGSTIWNSILTGAGYLLRERFEDVADYLNPVTNLIVGAIIVTYLFRLVTWRRG